MVTLDDFDVEEIQVYRREWIAGKSSRPYMGHIAVVVGTLENAEASVHSATSQGTEPLEEV